MICTAEYLQTRTSFAPLRFCSSRAAKVRGRRSHPQQQLGLRRGTRRCRYKMQRVRLDGGCHRPLRLGSRGVCGSVCGGERRHSRVGHGEHARHVQELYCRGIIGRILRGRCSIQIQTTRCLSRTPSQQFGGVFQRRPHCSRWPYVASALPRRICVTLRAGTKPDVVAPGLNVRSAASNGFISAAGNCGTSKKSGTSMATPAVAALAAVTRQFFRSLAPPSLAPHSEPFCCDLVHALTTAARHILPCTAAAGALWAIPRQLFCGSSRLRLNSLNCYFLIGNPLILQCHCISCPLPPSSTLTSSPSSSSSSPVLPLSIWPVL
jgi:hypothetical protein